MRKTALSSMALLGVTRAQLWIERSKTFTVHSITPMNRLLTLVDSGDDNIVVQLDCVNDETGDVEIGPYSYNFNNIHRGDIGQRFCPVSDFGEEFINRFVIGHFVKILFNKTRPCFGRLRVRHHGFESIFFELVH